MHITSLRRLSDEAGGAYDAKVQAIKLRQPGFSSGSKCHYYAGPSIVGT